MGLSQRHIEENDSTQKSRTQNNWGAHPREPHISPHTSLPDLVDRDRDLDGEAVGPRQGKVAAARAWATAVPSQQPWYWAFALPELLPLIVTTPAWLTTAEMFAAA